MIQNCHRRTAAHLSKLAAVLVVLLAPNPLLWAQAGAVTLQNPRLTWLDNSGNPVTSGSLYTYVCGTTTDKDAYSDATLLTALPHPITLNSAGRAQTNVGVETAVYLAQACYKLVLKDSGGSTLWTQDNYYPATPIPTGTASATKFYRGDYAWATPPADTAIVQGRLTLTSGSPVTTADVTAATTLYYAPYQGNQIALYDGATTWTARTFTQISIAVPASTSQMYDVFVYDSSGTATLELLAWTNDTTRATALTTQDGVYVKTGATTRRYVGSVRTTTVSGQTEDSLTKRYLWNYYNRVTRPLRKFDATASWTYTTATWRQARASTANQVEAVIGVAEGPVRLLVAGNAANTNTNVSFAVALGEDSTSTPSANGIHGFVSSAVAGGTLPVLAQYTIFSTVGYHFYAWLENSTATGTTTWLGTSGFAGGEPLGGLVGSIEG